MKKQFQMGGALLLPFFVILFSAPVFANANCEITVIKILAEDKKGTDFRVGRKNRFLVHDAKTEGRSESMLLLSSGRSAELSFDDEKIKVTCRLTYSAVDLTFEIMGESGSVSSSLQVPYNAEVEVGSTLKDLSNKANTKALPDGITSEKVKEKVRSKFLIRARQNNF